MCEKQVVEGISGRPLRFGSSTCVSVNRRDRGRPYICTYLLPQCATVSFQTFIMFKPAARSLLASSLRNAKPSRNAFNYVPARTILTLKDVKYTANAVAQGAGRNGSVSSNGLELNLATPKELGGTGKGENPEQLFAMGYSACLLGAIQAVARTQGKSDMAKNAVVRASVHIGEPNEAQGFAIAVDIKVEGIDEELLKAGHAFCPYSRALGQGAVVNVSLA
ncbi:unnamed protein product [Cyclocybe aegerita]|uniref:Organic hydroperoxide resistance protein n=1 Tax=Cyclocybe aegerita TaxID=1973307 RepID=A0A8S0XMW2_CYCAE|nr:unnamed protein product [Cyclocybe aegerita]